MRQYSATITNLDRGATWTAGNIGKRVRDVETVWVDWTNDVETIDLGDDNTFCTLTLPKVKDGFEYLVEAGTSIYWIAAPGAAIAQILSIYHGSTKIAWDALRHVDAVGYLSFTLCCTFAPKEQASISFMAENNSGTTGTAYVRNRYLRARLIRRG